MNAYHDSMNIISILRYNETDNAKCGFTKHIKSKSPKDNEPKIILIDILY